MMKTLRGMRVRFVGFLRQKQREAEMSGELRAGVLRSDRIYG
jgi:hypothetical protein